MTDHKHEWKPDIYERAYCGAICKCGEALSEADVESRLNATEALSAKRARAITAAIDRLAKRVGLGEVGDDGALRTYADALAETTQAG